MSDMEFSNDFSYKGETFKNISLTWRLGVSRIELVKIRLADWTPRADRSGQAVYYYDCKTKEEVEQAIKDALTKPLIKVESLFETMWLEWKKEQRVHNTGETERWLKEEFLPAARKLKINT